MLHWQIRRLASCGFDKILILTGYLASTIQAYFGAGEQYGAALTCVTEEEPLGTGGALVNALPLLEPYFLLVYGDSYMRVDYRYPYDLLSKSADYAVVTLLPSLMSAVEVTANVAFDIGTGRVTRYVKSGCPECGYIEAGLSAFSRDVFAGLAPGEELSLETQILPNLVRGGKVIGVLSKEPFFDIGTVRSLEEAERRCNFDLDEN